MPPQTTADISPVAETLPVLNPVVAVFRTHEEAEGAIQKLHASGFDMSKLSILAKDYHTDEHVVGYYNTGDRMRYWGKLGAFWGGLWGLMVGSAFFWVPGVGPLLIAGPFLSVVVGALEGAVVVGGVSVLSAGLFSLGIPKNSVIEYEQAITVGKYLVIAHVAEAEAKRAQEILQTTNPESLNQH